VKELWRDSVTSVASGVAVHQLSVKNSLSSALCRSGE